MCLFWRTKVTTYCYFVKAVVVTAGCDQHCHRVLSLPLWRSLSVCATLCSVPLPLPHPLPPRFWLVLWQRHLEILFKKRVASCFPQIPAPMRLPFSPVVHHSYQLCRSVCVAEALAVRLAGHFKAGVSLLSTFLLYKVTLLWPWLWFSKRCLRLGKKIEQLESFKV